MKNKSRNKKQNEQNIESNRKDRSARSSVSVKKETAEGQSNTEAVTDKNKKVQNKKDRNIKKESDQKQRNLEKKNKAVSGRKPEAGRSGKECSESLTWFRPAIAALTIIWCGAWFYLVGANLYAQHLAETGSSFESLEKAAELDRFEHADYELAYVMSTMDPEAELPPEIKNRAEKYAEKLMKVNSNTIPYYLAGYYFNNGETEKGFDAALKYLQFMHSSPSAWQNTLNLLNSADDGSAPFQSGMQEVISLFDSYHAESLEEIELDEAARQFLEGYR